MPYYKQGRIISIRDINYELPVNNVYHSALLNRHSRFRIMKHFQQNIQDIDPLFITNALLSPAAMGAWAVVIEYKNEPLYVVRNLAHTNTSLLFRRILLVQAA